MFARLLSATSAAVLVGSAGALLGPASPAAAGQFGHLVYATPGESTWVVPAGVTGAVITVEGAAGGSETTLTGTITPGGKGGEVTGFLPLAAGQTVNIYVGGAGQSVQGTYNTVRSGGAGGLVGGGTGGSADDPGAGGGGGSWLYADGTPELVAAGGGGGSGSRLFAQQSPGGAGGGLTGADGSVIDSQSQYGPARGGTQAAGGAAGQNELTTGESAGGSGTGGHGGTASPTDVETFAGGGGGGGWYGGGGGGASGGAGGSSHISPDVFNGTTTSGVNAGNGSVTIDYGTVDTPSIDQNPLPHAIAGVAYSHTFVATGWPAASFTPVGGTLPDGLQLSSDGVLTGALTRAGTYSFTIGAYNSEAFSARDVQLVVDPGPATTFTAGVDSPTGGSGTVEAGGYATLVASVTDAYDNPVPVSVEFDLPAKGPWKFPGGSRTAIVPVEDTGRANAYVLLGAHVGTFKTSVTALGTSLAAITDKVKVVPAPGGMDGGGTQLGGLLGKPYDDPLTVFGVPAPTVTVHDGSLPPGLTLSGYDISGTPTHAGTYAFTLRIDNGAVSGPVDVPCTITIARTPTVGIAGVGVNPGGTDLFPVTLPVTLSAPATVPVTVHWRTKAGTATAPTSFLAAHGDLTIPAGESGGSVVVQVRGRGPGPGTLDFSVVLSAPVNARLDPASRSATCTILYG